MLVQGLQRLLLLRRHGLLGQIPDSGPVGEIGDIRKKLLGFVKRQQCQRQLINFVLRLAGDPPDIGQASAVIVVGGGIGGHGFAQLRMQLLHVVGQVMECALVLVLRLDQHSVFLLILLIAPDGRPDKGQGHNREQNHAQSSVHDGISFPFQKWFGCL
ncbi:hypothetical protein D3C76_1371050 [compost metagenome]